MTRKKKPAASLVRSSVAEYLTFVAASGTGGVEVPTINYHLKKVFKDSELEESAVIRNFLITAAEGKTYDASVTLLWPDSTFVAEGEDAGVGSREEGLRSMSFDAVFTESSRQYATWRIAA